MVQAGDELRAVGNALQHWRGSTLIALRLLTQGAVVPSGVVTTEKTIESLFLYQETIMPGQNVALTHVAKNDTTGSVTMTFSNGVNQEFASFQDMKDSVSYLDTAGQVAQDLLIAKTAANSPDGSNLQNMVGGSVAINLQADVPVVLTNPV